MLSPSSSFDIYVSVDFSDTYLEAKMEKFVTW